MSRPLHDGRAYYPGVLIGRDVEQARIAAALEDARAGRARVLVLRGEPGVGKTTLLEVAIKQATDFQILATTGVQSERELPFAGLHALCAPMLGRLKALPDPQRDALGTALGLSAGPVVRCASTSKRSAISIPTISAFLPKAGTKRSA